MAKVKNEDEKTEQTVGATVDVNPEDVKLQAFLEAEVEKLNAELEAARIAQDVVALGVILKSHKVQKLTRNCAKAVGVLHIKKAV